MVESKKPLYYLSFWILVDIGMVIVLYELNIFII